MRLTNTGRRVLSALLTAATIVAGWYAATDAISMAYNILYFTVIMPACVMGAQHLGGYRLVSKLFKL